MVGQQLPIQPHHSRSLQRIEPAHHALLTWILFGAGVAKARQLQVFGVLLWNQILMSPA